MIEDANFWKKSSRLYIVVVVADFMYGVNVDELYGLSLNVSQILLIVFLSVLAAIAGAGAPGLVSISMVSIVLLPLGLPAQAITILLIAIYPIIDPITTVANVKTNLAIAAVIARGLEKETELKPT